MKRAVEDRRMGYVSSGTEVYFRPVSNTSECLFFAMPTSTFFWITTCVIDIEEGRRRPVPLHEVFYLDDVS